MTKTQELLGKLTELLMQGKIQETDVPMEQVQACILEEIEIRKQHFSQEQYQNLQEKINEICMDEECSVLKKLEELKIGILFLPDAIGDGKTNVYEEATNLVQGYQWLENAYASLVVKIRERMQTVSYFNYVHGDNQDAEVSEILAFVNKNGKPEIFNYDFVGEYDDYPCDIIMDEEEQYPYIEYNGNRVYYPKDWEEKKIKDWHRSIVYEQDKKSPHCYECTDQSWCVQEGDVVIDAGAGEGNFTLSIIEKASKVYIVEADEIWQKPLELTFRKWKDKVVFVNQYLSGKESEAEVTVDALGKKDDINFIKMDIEGFEIPALSGAKEVLQKGNVRCALCTYHRKSDEENIKNILESYGFETECSRGYMYIHDDINVVLDAELRRGIIYGKKE